MGTLEFSPIWGLGQPYWGRLGLSGPFKLRRWPSVGLGGYESALCQGASSDDLYGKAEQHATLLCGDADMPAACVASVDLTNVWRPFDLGTWFLFENSGRKDLRRAFIAIFGEGVGGKVARSAEGHIEH